MATTLAPLAHTLRSDQNVEKGEGDLEFLCAQTRERGPPLAFASIHRNIFPQAMEPRQITRWEVARYAREAYDLGVRVLGGCCGFEPYHIRAIAEELAKEKGGLPEGSDKSDHDLSVLKKKSDLGRTDFSNK